MLHNGTVEVVIKRWASNRAQRVVVSIGLAALLYLTAATIHSEIACCGGGWFNYAPNSSVTFSPGDRFSTWSGWPVVVWGGAVLVWTAVSVWLFRSKGPAG